MAKTIKIGIAGPGWWAEQMYLPSFGSHPDCEVVAICGRNRDKAKALANKFNIDAVYTEYDQFLAHDGLDAVAIATPNDLHHAMAIDAIKAGLHVMCEKPLALTVAHAQEMYALAEENGVKHMVLFTWRFLPHIRYMIKLVSDGYVGKVHQMSLEFTGGSNLGREFDWYVDSTRGDLGVVGDLGPHMFDLFSQFSGPICSISADIVHAVDIKGAIEPVNDCAICTVRSDSGVSGAIHLSMVAASGDRMMKLSVTVHGSDGVLECLHIFDGAEQRVDLRGIGKGAEKFEVITIPSEMHDGSRDDDLFGTFSRLSVGPRSFVDAIRDNLPIPSDFAAGLAAQIVIDAAFTSNKNRRWIDIQ